MNNEPIPSLIHENKNSAYLYSEKEKKEAFSFCEGYKEFLNTAKTERLSVEYARNKAILHGFVPYEPKKKYRPGDKVYIENRDKNIILLTFGKSPLSEGINILASHVDSPRFDIKPMPLYEKNELAFFKTHYYGGIKKYQWTTVPLSLQGVIIKENGEKLKVNIGDAEDDPAFCMNDLLVHLAGDQMKRSAKEIVKGEEFNLLIGSLPSMSESCSIDEKVKYQILEILYKKYGVKERDLISAELHAVPAYPVKDIGFDCSMIGGYGQDDHVCAYATLQAVLNCDAPEKTAMIIFADKEETGSYGNTGLQSRFMMHFIKELADNCQAPLREILNRSSCISADVAGAVDPTFPEVLDPLNACYCNHGVAVMKYSGSGGKYSTSDASAEFVDRITRFFDKNEIHWQISELGKVDGGGGGTVALLFANENIDVIDVGIPVLSMHSPFEITAKLDVYTAYKAYLQFLKCFK